MKTHLILAAALLGLQACGRPASPAPAPEPITGSATGTFTAAPATPMPASTPTEAPAPSAPPAVATSRGPELEATDPTTVRLASGGLQFVEFFRFT